MVLQYENALALRTSLETGMRIGDVLALEVKDLSKRTITYKMMKTGIQDRKTISADLAKRLKQVSGKRWIFTGRFGDKPRTRSAVWKDVKKAKQRLGIIENLSCHSARKTYAVTKFHEDGLPETQKALKHDRIDTTMIYAFSDMLTDSKPSIDLSEEFAERVAEKVIEKIHNS